MSHTHNRASGEFGARERLGGWYAWCVVGLLFLAGLISFLDRQIINLLVDPIKADLSISDTQVSLLQGLAFALFYSAMALPMGWLADNWRRVYVIVLGMLLWSVATMICGLAWSFGSLFAARMLVGIGEATLGPAGNSLIASYFPKDQATRAISLFASAAYIGTGVSVLFGGLIVDTVATADVLSALPFYELQPWQVTFLVAGIPGIVLGLIILALVTEPQRAKGPAGSTDGASLRDALSFLWRHRRPLSPMYMGLPLLASLQYGLAAWIPSYFSRIFGWSAVEIGLRYGLIAAGFGFCGAVSAGFIADVLRKRGVADANVMVGIAASALSAPVIVAFGLSNSETLSVALLVFIALLGSMPFGVGVAAIAMNVPERIRAQMVAIYFLVANLVGLSLGPSLIAIFTDYVFADTFNTGSSIALAAVVLTPLALLFLLAGRAQFRQMAIDGA